MRKLLPFLAMLISFCVHAQGTPGSSSAPEVFSNKTINADIVHGYDTPLKEGAVGNGAADDTTPVQTCATTGACFLPAGFNFRVSSPIQVPTNGTFVGAGQRSIITGSSVTGGIVQIGTGGPLSGWPTAITAGNFKIAGTGTNALKMNGTYNDTVFNINTAGSYTDAFWFDIVFGCTFSNMIANNLAVSDADFKVGGSFNANAINGWYTGQTNNQPYNFFFEDSLGTGSSFGNTFNNLTAQGGVVGLYVGGNQGSDTFNGFYSENVVKPIVLGNAATNKRAYGLTFNSPLLSGPLSSHPSYSSRVALIDFNYVNGVTFNSPFLSGSAGYDNHGNRLRFSGGTGTAAYGYLIVNAAGVPKSAVILYGGLYSVAPTAAAVVSPVGSGLTLRVVTSGTNPNIVVTGVTASGGTGYINVPPVVATYTLPYRVQINAPSIFGYSGQNLPIYPLIVRSSTAQGEVGVNVVGDIVYNPAYSSPANLTQSPGSYAFQHYLSWFSGNGAGPPTINYLSVVPISFP